MQGTFSHSMDNESSQSDERLIQSALAQGAEACVLLLHSNPHLRQALIIDLLRSCHQLGHADILRIFSLTVFGYEPDQAVDYLKELKPAGYCGHVFKEGEISYKCAHAPSQRSMRSKQELLTPLNADVSTALRMQLVWCAPSASMAPTTLATATSCISLLNAPSRFSLLNLLTCLLRQKTRAGGCCDCGDYEAWKKEGFCTYIHPTRRCPQHKPHAFCSKHSGVSLNSLTDIPQIDLNRWGPAFRALVDFIVDTYVGRAGGAPGLAIDSVDSSQNMCGARSCLVAASVNTEVAGTAFSCSMTTFIRLTM
jgi:hypothetical protein